jgi:release factor glutamine methyltransferase
MSAVLDVEPIRIIVHGEQEISAEHLRLFNDAVAQRAKHKPLAYIVGRKHFLNWEFWVNENVLIPRPETETLVELAVEQLKQRFPGQALLLADIGTGSGAIGLSMLAFLPTAKLLAIDISEPALVVAGQNARDLNVADRVSFLAGDLLSPLEGWQGEIHCLIANLPYIAEQEFRGLQPEIIKYEPLEALISGADGLLHYCRLLKDAKQFLRPGGLIFMEIGSNQATQAQKIFVRNGLKPRVAKDLAGLDRIVWAVT